MSRLPYRGLERFEAEQAEFFFGRDADTRALIEKLAGSNFVAVVGASGSGKSSFVRAGLLPKLTDNAIHGSSGWRTLLLLPGAAPLRALANRLASEVPNSERIETVSDLVEQMKHSEGGMRNTLLTWYADS